MDTSTHNAIESLRTFAVTTGRSEFAHVCTAALLALDGEESDQWAVELVTEVISRLDMNGRQIVLNDWCLKVIDDIDCTRPDSAIAKGGIEV